MRQRRGTLQIIFKLNLELSNAHNGSRKSILEMELVFSPILSPPMRTTFFCQLPKLHMNGTNEKKENQHTHSLKKKRYRRSSRYCQLA